MISPYDKSSLGRHREGHPELRPRDHPVQRRHGHPPVLPVPPRSAARSWSRWSTTRPRRAGWPCATCAGDGPPGARGPAEGRRALDRRARPGGEGPGEGHPRAGGRDRPAARPQRARAPRGLSEPDAAGDDTGPTDGPAPTRAGPRARSWGGSTAWTTARTGRRRAATEPGASDPVRPPTGVRIIGAETAAEITSRAARSSPPARRRRRRPRAASVRITEEPACGRARRRRRTGRAAVPEPTAPTRAAALDRAAHRPGPGGARRDDDGDAADRASCRRRGARRTPTGWPTRRTSSPPCSPTNVPRSARSTSRWADEERRPWEFDLDSVQPGQPRSSGGRPRPITEPVPWSAPTTGALPSRRRRPTGGVRRDGRPPRCPAVRRWLRRRSPPRRPSATTVRLGRPPPTGPPGRSPTGRRDGAGERRRRAPSGTARVGRARRAGLLPGRMKAKRPDDPAGRRPSRWPPSRPGPRWPTCPAPDAGGGAGRAGRRRPRRRAGAATVGRRDGAPRPGRRAAEPPDRAAPGGAAAAARRRRPAAAVEPTAPRR